MIIVKIKISIISTLLNDFQVFVALSSRPGWKIPE